MERLLTTEDVAEYLRVDVVTVRRLTARGELTAYRIGGEFRFTRADIEDFVKQQRIAATEDGPGSSKFGRFDRFTERARKVLTLAQEEARQLQHNYVGTEHLLLALLEEGQGVAAKALHEMGVEATHIRKAIDFIIGRGAETVTGAIGLTPRAKKVIELAVDEARTMQHHYIGTEHLLLGLIREGEGIGAKVLENMGIKLEKARQITMGILSKINTPPDVAPDASIDEAPASTAAQPDEAAIPTIPEGAASLLKEDEERVTCDRCTANNPAYFHFCFNCGKKLAGE